MYRSDFVRYEVAVAMEWKMKRYMFWVLYGIVLGLLVADIVISITGLSVRWSVGE
jgi:tetrahydromethanopterin S-methyltransferase subunit G